MVTSNPQVMNIGMKPAWVSADGPEADVVVSTRARLARNLAALPFPWRASEQELRRTAELMTSAARRVEALGTDIGIIRIDDLVEREKINLIDAHVVSPEHTAGGPHRLVILERAGRLAIMVNEEDHLRIQALLPGLACEETWEAVNEIDEGFSRSLEFAYSERYGYLTASLTNVGTGLRISALMHLGGLAMLGKVRSTLQAAYELGVSVRGLFGEGTSGLGDLFQVSNEVTLGLEEREIVGRVRGVARYLIAEERRARQELFREQRQRLTGRLKDSITAAQGARSVSAAEMLRLLSTIRVACSVGAASGLEQRAFNEVLLGLRLRHRPGGSPFDAAKDDMERASILRRLAGQIGMAADEAHFA